MGKLSPPLSSTVGIMVVNSGVCCIFVRSGWNPNGDQILNTGFSGNGWSSRDGNMYPSESNNYNLNFTNFTVKPFDRSLRYRGLPLRCLVR